MKWRSKFEYGPDYEYSFTTALAVRPWIPGAPTVGSARRAASGVGAGYVVRRDAVLGLGIRIFESEWPDLVQMIAWGQLMEPIRWYPDRTGTSYIIDLESPKAGEDWTQVIDQEYQRAREVSIMIRKYDGTVWDLQYFTITRPGGLAWGP